MPCIQIKTNVEAAKKETAERIKAGLGRTSPSFLERPRIG